ncbi:hypothetical protein M408DRAFT_329200 [Serendipita vermifera MAFF 305830]|uniref:PNPLA domain-containing protein n=1 Tax=Serendipita vermifera MAFF 305830 TaxID=933852 RepID=A0A0C2XI27_SERVB|nr:hypothetical protein M408DRAFT_329200 [Serendipita vermifera MAFF 305830]
MDRSSTSRSNSFAQNLSERSDIRLACFDGGGVKTLSQLVIMKEIMKEVRNRKYPHDPARRMLPSEEFDMIGGSDTGGLISIMFSRLQMSIEEVMDEFSIIVEKVYKPRFSHAIRRTQALRACLKDMFERRGWHLDCKLSEGWQESHCAGFCIVLSFNELRNQVCLRSYKTRQGLPSDITIIDAMLSTCASYPDFEPVTSSIGFEEQTFVGASLGANNPSGRLISEAHALYGGRAKVLSILSIGSGHLGNLTTPASGDDGSLKTLYQQMLSDGEVEAEETKMRTIESGIYFRLSVRHGMQGVEIAHENSDTRITAQAYAYLNDGETRQTVTDCVRSLAEAYGRVSLDNLMYTAARKPTYKAAPARTQHYIKRSGPWQALVNAISPDQHSQRVVIVAGMTGCGKTQLVTEILRQYNPERSRLFDHALFVDGSSEHSIKSDLITHVQFLTGMEGSRFEFEDAMAFFQRLNNRRWLIVYDNVDDIRIDIRSLLPRCDHGVVIITTRNQLLRTLASENSYLRLDVMSKDESIELIFRCVGNANPSDDERHAAAIIADKLGYLPVALAQAGCFIANEPCSCTHYLGLLSTHLAELMNSPAGDLQNLSAYAAFDLTYHRLPSVMQKLVNILSFFHYTDFPMAAIAHTAAHPQYIDAFPFESRDATHASAVNVVRDICSFASTRDNFAVFGINRMLQAYSLASLTLAPLTSLAYTHPLMREWAFNRMEPGQRIMFQEAACLILISCTDANHLHPYLPPHIIEVMARLPVDCLHINTRAGLGKLLRAASRWSESQTVWAPVHDMLQRKHGPMNLHVATAKLELAATYLDDGFVEMERLEKEVVGIRSKLLGIQHLDTLWAIEELSETLVRQDRYSDALIIKQGMLNELERQLKPNHPVILDAKRTLALLLKHLCRLSDAELIQREVMEEQKLQQGENHLKTIDAVWNLALTYCEWGRHQDSEPLLLKALEGKKKILGETHHDTLVAMTWLALNYHEQNRGIEAARLQLKVVEQRRKSWGPNNSYTVEALELLAAFYNSQNRFDDLEPLRVQLLKARWDVLGEEHPDTLIAMNNLALNYSNQSRHADAEALQVEVLSKRIRLEGEDTLDVATCMHNLAWTYHDTGRLQEAMVYATKAERICRSVLPADDPELVKTTRLIETINKSLKVANLTKNTASVDIQINVLITGKSFPLILFSLILLFFMPSFKETCTNAVLLWRSWVMWCLKWYLNWTGYGDCVNEFPL